MLNKALQIVFLSFIEIHRQNLHYGSKTMFRSLGFGAIIAMLTASSACGAPRNDLDRTKNSAQVNAKDIAYGDSSSMNTEPLNKKFTTLDDYLAWLQQTQAPVDGSWYEEIRPGIYQLRTGNLRIVGPEGEVKQQDQIFTRQQLMRKFGFAR